MNAGYRSTYPLIFLFVFIFLVVAGAMVFFNDRGIDFRVIGAANCLLFMMSLLVFLMQHRAMQHTNPNVFIRSVMAGMMIKMGIVAAAVMAYVLLAGKNANKPAVYISLLLYLVYLAMEVAAVMKLNKKKNA